MNKFYEKVKSAISAFLHDPLFLSKWESKHTHDGTRTTSWVHDGYNTIAGKDGYQGDLYMFDEDLRLRVMSYRNRRHTTFKAVLKPYGAVSDEILENSELEKVISKSISKHDYSFDDLSENITDFIRDSTQTIAAHSEIYYEITCKKNEQGEIEELEFHYIYPPSMRKLFGKYAQYIPYKVAKRSSIKAGLRFMPKNKVLHITAPKKLGGKRELRRIIKRLAKMSTAVMPDFYLKAMEDDNSIGFDFNIYVHSRYMEKAILTKKYGWNQRDYSDKNILEYYSMYRYLKTANAMALYRQHIIQEFNNALNNDFVKSGVEVALEGIETEGTITKDFEKLKEGGLKFVDLVKKD